MTAGPKPPYRCPKCEGGTYRIGQLRGAGSLLSALLDVNNESFSYVACATCGFTEFYTIISRTLLKQVVNFDLS